jgi:hypothetical protein
MVKDYHHWLQGAILLIESRNRLEEDIYHAGIWCAFTKNVVANETLSAVPSNRCATFSCKYWKSYLQPLDETSDKGVPTDAAVLQKCYEEGYFESLLGCPAVFMLVLAEITEYLWLRELVSPIDLLTQLKYQRWEYLLLRWNPSSMDASKIHRAESYRYAALVYLTRRIRKLPFTDSVVQVYVRLAIQHISYSESVNWPRMIVALELDDIEYPQLAASVFKRIQESHVSRSRVCTDRTKEDEMGDIVSATWLRRSQSKTWEDRVAVDWLDIAAERGPRWTFW